MRRKSLEQLKEKKFNILEEVKSVNIGNEMAVTISIGIGINADSYAHTSESARIAMELALGRGGDQVTALLIMVVRPSRWKRLPESKPE